MMARIRKAMEEKDQGFTLIELLVVMIIIGILAAIAIPVFLNQRQKAVDSAMKSDLRTVAQAEETYSVDTQTYLGFTAATDVKAATSNKLNVTLSNGNQAAVTTPARTGADASTYCVVVSRTSAASSGSQTAWVYVSDRGGIQASGVTACPTT